MCAVHAVPGCVKITYLNESFDSIEVHWDVPDKPNGVITQYVINYTEPGGITLNVTTSNTSCILQSLEPCTSYNITVAAETKVGVGEVSGCPLSAASAKTIIISENYYHCTQTNSFTHLLLNTL